MPRPQYEVTIMVEGDPDTSPDLLKAAMRDVFKLVQRIPPNRRFDWRSVMIDVQPYTV